MKKNTNTISFVIFKNNSGKSTSLTLQTRQIKLICAGILLTFLTLGIGIYLSYNTNIKQVAYSQLKKENRHYQEKIKNITETYEQMSTELSSLIEKEEELELLLGKVHVKRRKKKRKKVKAYNKEFSKLLNSPKDSIEKLYIASAFISNYLDIYKQKYNGHLDKTHYMITKFEHTPSIHPLYGNLMSRYGWRSHPVSGRRRFHRGIDIASWTGAPIQATADGIVEYAGWSPTFGEVIVIDHYYGFRTIYAHCSVLLAKKRDIVKKGEVIAQVGSTGLSTGPHLHYEVKRGRQSLNPIAFLDLDMFTARRKIW
ncbi:hypothetical protein DID78_06140 [Candidatus Marinamargulisbacteria bacterium SCGC AG-343-D04]|nr:hypothetical protein DID78_06140 [Candidatus Marinamargulisbacteria bacterium SCGC AG-343-D04]